MRTLTLASYRGVFHGFQGLHSACQCRYSTTQVSSGSGVKTEEDTEAQKTVLNSALSFVPKYGWSKQAIIAGAEAVGQSGVIHRFYSGGEIKLVQHFYESCNQQLTEHLKLAGDPTNKNEPFSLVKDAFKIRLLMIEPYKKEWPQALGIMTLPQNMPIALNCLFTLVDDVAYHTGDRSVNFNWYIHRITLAGIYKATELYFTQDNSKDFQETWNFLGRRLEDGIMLQNSMQYSSHISRLTRDITTAGFTTVRNMLGFALVNRSW